MTPKTPKTSPIPSSGRRSRTRLLVSLVAFVVAVSAPAQQLTWQKTFGAAVNRGKPIFVDFHAEWCGPCKMLEQSFKDPKVIGLLRRTTCLSIDVDNDPADAQRFKVSSIPRLLVLSPDGGKILWDAVGYRDADTLADELRDALHVTKAIGSVAVPAADPPALTHVRMALEGGKLANLVSSNPTEAQAGLRMLVQKLGAYKEADFKEVAALFTKAGRPALPALLEGMADKSLAVRVGATKVAQSLLSATDLHQLPYDPWSPTPTRTAQLAAWRKRLGT